MCVYSMELESIVVFMVSNLGIGIGLWSHISNIQYQIGNMTNMDSILAILLVSVKLYMHLSI